MSPRLAVALVLPASCSTTSSLVSMTIHKCNLQQHVRRMQIYTCTCDQSRHGSCSDCSTSCHHRHPVELCNLQSLCLTCSINSTCNKSNVLQQFTELQARPSTDLVLEDPVYILTAIVVRDDCHQLVLSKASIDKGVDECGCQILTSRVHSRAGGYSAFCQV